MCRVAETPNFDNCSHLELHASMKIAVSARSFRKHQVIHLFSLGFGTEQVCQAMLMSGRTVRRIVQMFNSRGIDGLIEKKYRGRPKKLTKATQAELMGQFKNTKEDAPVWSARKFHGHIKEELKVDISIIPF